MIRKVKEEVRAWKKKKVGTENFPRQTNDSAYDIPLNYDHTDRFNRENFSLTITFSCRSD